MTRVIASVLILSCFGCVHRSHIPIPTDSWTYVYASDQTTEYILHLSLSTTDNVNIAKREFSFMKFDINSSSLIPFYPLSYTSIYGSGSKKSAHIHSSVTIDEVTSVGISVDVSWSRTTWDNNISTDAEIDSKIIIPFSTKGQNQIDGLHYSWEWTKLNPNQKLEPTWTTPVDSVNINSQAAHF